MSKEWIDVTVALEDGMVHWPGDPECKIFRAVKMEEGGPARALLRPV